MLPGMTQIPEPYRSAYLEGVQEMGQEWADRYGEEALRAAATVLGDEGIIPDAR